MKIASSLWRWFITTLCFVYVFIGGFILSITYFRYLRLKYKNNNRVINKKARIAISKSFDLMLRFSTLCRAYKVYFNDLDLLYKDKGEVIIANHPTYIDYVILASKIPDLNCIVKEKLAKNFFLKNVIDTAGYIVNTDADDKLSEIREKILQGDKVLIFPEGTRTDKNKEIKLKRGFAHLALRCPCSLRILIIQCNENFLGKNYKWYHTYEKSPIFTISVKDFISEMDLLKCYGDKEYSIGSRYLTKRIQELFISYLK